MCELRCHRIFVDVIFFFSDVWILTGWYISLFSCAYYTYIFFQLCFFYVSFSEEAIAWRFQHFADLLPFNVYSFWCGVLWVLTCAQYHTFILISIIKITFTVIKNKTWASPTQPSLILVNHVAPTDYFTVSKVLPLPQLHVIGYLHYL